MPSAHTAVCRCSFSSAAQRICASAARPATRNNNALAMPLPSGPRPVQAQVGRPTAWLRSRWGSKLARHPCLVHGTRSHLFQTAPRRWLTGMERLQSLARILTAEGAARYTLRSRATSDRAVLARREESTSFDGTPVAVGDVSRRAPHAIVLEKELSDFGPHSCLLFSIRRPRSRVDRARIAQQTAIGDDPSHGSPFFLAPALSPPNGV